MSTNPNPITSQFISEIQGMEASVVSETAQIAADQVTIQSDAATIQNDAAVLDATQTQLAKAQASLAIAQHLLARKPVIYTGLEKYALFTADKKIPFEWIQPGNTGNTGGAAAVPHGTETWNVVAGQPTEIDAAPVNIAPKSDNFFNYAVLPYPVEAPRRMFIIVKNFAAKSELDWSKSQQLEGPQIEYFGGGYQYTACPAYNPKTGLHYWNGSTWVQVLVNGLPVILDMGLSAMGVMEVTMDTDAHTYTYEWLVVNDTLYPLNAVCNANPNPSNAKQFAVAVQLDGQASAPAYAALLDCLCAGWQ